VPAQVVEVLEVVELDAQPQHAQQLELLRLGRVQQEEEPAAVEVEELLSLEEHPHHHHDDEHHHLTQVEQKGLSYVETCLTLQQFESHYSPYNLYKGPSRALFRPQFHVQYKGKN